ncbi:MAG: diguanylate cyclase [Rhizobiaceae bacterium]|nr:diguanylate cyclase [Rhizobiaceae bacterium]
MDQGLFIALLSPVVMTLLGTAFMVFAIFQRRRRHIFVLGGCYLITALGFTIQSFELGLGFTTKKFVANLLFVIALSLLSGAVIARQMVPVPYAALGITAVVTLAVFSWFLLIDVDFLMRVLAINFGLGTMCLIAGIFLLQSRRRALIDRSLAWLAFLGFADFMIRPLVAAWVGVGSDPLDRPLTSSYWLMTNLSAIVFCLLIALTLLSAVAIDAMRELTTESRTDPLSGLLNRRGFEEQAVPYLSTTDADTMPISLILADLDHFKEVNDLYGHEAGDRLITGFARLIGDRGGPQAIIARTGGEEFALLLPNYDLGSACLLAESIRRDTPILQHEVAAGVVTGRTCSLGVTARSGREELWTFFHRADDALMQAKRNGRNSVRTAFARPTTRLAIARQAAG